MLRVAKFLKVAGINFCKSKKSAKFTLYDLHLKESFE